MEQNKLTPTMFVFAGNNGSGKSTIRNLIVETIGVNINIDPDSIARRLSTEDFQRIDIQAGKEAIRLMKECIRQQRDFSVETTLSGKSVIQHIKEARKLGFRVVMYYVGTENVNLNIQRIDLRVRNGGHHIPTEDILRRKERSIHNLIYHLELIDYLQLIDNTKTRGKIIVEYGDQKILYQDDKLPDWTTLIVEAMR